MDSIRDPKYIFICSAGHSGSTLLDMLIGSHGQCESLGEVVLLPMEFALNRAVLVAAKFESARCGLKLPGGWMLTRRRTRTA